MDITLTTTPIDLDGFYVEDSRTEQEDAKLAAAEFIADQNDEALRAFVGAIKQDPSWGARALLRLLALLAGDPCAQNFIAGLQKVVRYIDDPAVVAALLADRKMVRHIQRLAEESVENTVMLIQAFGVDTVFGTLPQTVKVDSAAVVKDEADLDARMAEAHKAEVLAKFKQAGLATWMIRGNLKRIRNLMRVIQSDSAAQIVSENGKVLVIRKRGILFEYNVTRNVVTKATRLQRNKR